MPRGAHHLRAFCRFQDASMVGICRLPDLALLDEGLRNPGFAALAQDPRRRQARMLAAGIVMADLKESMEAPPSAIQGHTHAIVVLNEYGRDPRRDEPGAEWCTDAPAHRAWLRATETAVIIATQIRLLGWDDKAHTATSSDVALNLVAVVAAVVMAEGGRLLNAYLGERVGVAGVTTTLDLAPDFPLAARRTDVVAHEGAGLVARRPLRDVGAEPRPVRAPRRRRRPAPDREPHTRGQPDHLP
jgi:hypothetical protein